MIRIEPKATRHTGAVRYGTSDVGLYPWFVKQYDEPDPDLVDVWVAETQDENVRVAVELGIPVLCESGGPLVVHFVNGIVGPFAPITLDIVNHLTCAVPQYLVNDLSIPNHRPRPFPKWTADWRPMFYGEPTKDWHRAWIEATQADVGVDCYHRVVYIGHRPDVHPSMVAARGGVPVLDRAPIDWPRHCYMLQGAKRQFLKSPTTRLEKIQRAAFHRAWRYTREADPCCVLRPGNGTDCPWPSSP